MSVLVTGGAGFLVNQTVMQLLKKGFKVTIFDNLHNSVEETVHRVRNLVGPELSLNLQFHLGDIRNEQDLEKLFSQAKFNVVIHFAGLKAVAESVAERAIYLDSILNGSITLYKVMAKYNCKKLIFSSHPIVYGHPKKIPWVEDFELKGMSPYGFTAMV